MRRLVEWWRLRQRQKRLTPTPQAVLDHFERLTKPGHTQIARQRGPITDIYVVNAKGKVAGSAAVHCAHGKWWEEGGTGCLPCLKAWRSDPTNPHRTT